MFGIWHRKRLKEGGLWYVMVPDFETSTDAFYQGIRDAVREKRLPDVEVSERELREGGMLSARRRYLRLRHERVVFDVCSAPFGTGWYFSCRFGEIPLRLRWWEAALILAAGLGLLALHIAVLGSPWGPVFFALNLASFLFLLNHLAATELYGLDAALMRIPALGAFYETYFRGDSYHRDDTRRMCLASFDRIVRDAVEAVAGQRPEGSLQFQEEPPRAGLWGRLRAALSRVG
jgi:hypothetical protein